MGTATPHEVLGWDHPKSPGRAAFVYAFARSAPFSRAQTLMGTRASFFPTALALASYPSQPVTHSESLILQGSWLDSAP